MASRQNSSRQMILSIESAVLSVRLESSSNLCLATWIASLVGTLVKRETTSNDTKISSFNCCVVTKATKSLEFLTCEMLFPTRGIGCDRDVSTDCK